VVDFACFPFPCKKYTNFSPQAALTPGPRDIGQSQTIHTIGFKVTILPNSTLPDFYPTFGLTSKMAPWFSDRHVGGRPLRRQNQTRSGTNGTLTKPQRPSHPTKPPLVLETETKMQKPHRPAPAAPKDTLMLRYTLEGVPRATPRSTSPIASSQCWVRDPPKQSPCSVGHLVGQ